MNEKVFFLEERLKILTRDYKDLEQALNDSINVQEEMTGKENEYKKRIKELTAQIKYFQDQGDLVSQQKSIHLAEENKKLKDVIYWLNEDIDDMKQKLNASQGIKSEYDELRQDQTNLRASLVNYAKNEEKFKRNENMLENQISQLKLENSELKSKVETHMQVCEEYKQKSQKEIEGLRQKMLNMIDIEVLREVELEKEHLKKSLALDTKTISQLKEKIELREEEVLRIVKELKQKYEKEINKVIDECDEQILIHAEALEVEKEKFEDHLKKCERAREKTRGIYENEIKRLKEEIDEKQSSIEDQRREISDEEKKLHDANQEILELEKKNEEIALVIDELEKNIKDREAKEMELSETIEALLVEKEVEDEIKRTLENQMSEIKNENMLKNEKIKELSISLEDIMKEKNQLEVEIEHLSQKIKVLEEKDSQRLLNEKQVIVEREENHENEERVENFEHLQNQVSKGLEEWFFEEKEVILEDYRVTNENLRKDFGRANEIISELREKEVVYNSQIEELQEYLHNCVKKEDYEILQKKIISLENTNKTLKQQIQNPDESMRHLKLEIEHLEQVNKSLKKDLDEVFDEFESLKQEQEKRFKRLSQIKNRSHNYELNGKHNNHEFIRSNDSIIEHRQIQLQIERKQEKELMSSENDDDLEESQSENKSDEKNDLRKEIQCFMNQLVERILEVDQTQ